MNSSYYTCCLHLWRILQSLSRVFITTSKALSRIKASIHSTSCSVCIQVRFANCSFKCFIKHRPSTFSMTIFLQVSFLVLCVCLALFVSSGFFLTYSEDMYALLIATFQPHVLNHVYVLNHRQFVSKRLILLKASKSRCSGHALPFSALLCS